MRTADVILLITTIIVALIAGLFYAYSVSVVGGLGKLPDTEYLRAMQSINRAILNPLFLGCFMGALFLLPLSTWMAYRQAVLQPGFWFLLVALIAYAAGVFGVTMLGNVPMNNVLDKLDITGSTPEVIRAQRSAFEARWNTLNHVRTVFAILSLIFTVLACLYRLGGYRSAGPEA